MKNTNCVISVKGMQNYCDEGLDPGDVEMMAEGVIYETDGKVFAEYEETEATGMEGTVTSVEMCSEYVSLMRSGKTDMTLLFIKGRQTTNYYDTPFGVIVMGLDTQEIENEMTPDGGRIKVTYGISMNNVFTGTNTFEINVRKV